MGKIYNLGGLSEFTYDASRNLVYMATSNGVLYAFDTTAGALNTKVSLGGSLTGLDITPDGRFLVVGSSDSTADYDATKTPANGAIDKIYRISLTDLSVSTQTFRTLGSNEAGVNDVGAVSATRTIATVSANSSFSTFTHMRLSDASTGTAQEQMVMATDTSTFATGSRLTPSEDHKYILFQEGPGAGSQGRLSIYFTEQNDFLAVGTNFRFKTSGSMTGHSVVSEAVNLVAHQTTNSLVILDRFLNSIKDLTAFGTATQIVGLQFNAGGRQLFLWDTDRDAIRVIETGTWQEVGEMKLASNVPSGQLGASWGDMLVVDHGRSLILDTLDGFEVVDLTTDLKINQVGGAGAETMYGSVGANTLRGGAGDDRLIGGSGANRLWGDEGQDSISGGAAFDDINGNQGADTAHGNAGDDWVVGGKDNDQVYGDAGADIVYGNLGNDTVSGGDGNDWVRGGQGDDSVSGDAGNDVVWGDRGDDTVSGGAGADTFRFFSGGGVDRVTDFSFAEGDRVVIEGGAAWTLSQSGSDTVVALSGGADTLVLVGVSLSSLPVGWIVAG